MRDLQVFATRQVEAARRVQYWNDLVCDLLTHLNCAPFEPTAFEGSLTSTGIGTLRLAEVISAPAQVIHTRSHVANTSEPVFFVHLQKRGRSVNWQDGREAVLTDGDFTLCDTTRPYRLAFEDINDMLVLRIPQEQLRRRLRDPEQLTALHMSGSRGVSGLLSRMLVGCWEQCREDLDPAVDALLSRNILDLLAACFLPQRSEVAGSEAARTTRILQIKAFIEARLDDPDLSPAMIAKAFHCTSRYVHLLFQEQELSLSRYILQARLERCAQALDDPREQRRSITDIAFGCGFNSATQFGRVFKEKYGLTPRDFRHRRGNAN